MTRVAVVSDSHGGRLHLERFVEFCRAEGIDRVFHLGDIVDDAKWLERRLEVPLTYVAGNCDYMAREAREVRETVEGKRFLLVHGDRYGVKYGYDKLSYYAEENQMDVALFGHTHRSFAGYVGEALLVNPGALKSGSLCVMEVTPRDIVPRILDIDQWYNDHDNDHIKEDHR